MGWLKQRTRKKSHFSQFSQHCKFLRIISLKNLYRHYYGNVKDNMQQNNLHSNRKYFRLLRGPALSCHSRTSFNRSVDCERCVIWQRTNSRETAPSGANNIFFQVQLVSQRIDLLQTKRGSFLVYINSWISQVAYGKTLVSHKNILPEVTDS